MNVNVFLSKLLVLSYLFIIGCSNGPHLHKSMKIPKAVKLFTILSSLANSKIIYDEQGEHADKCYNNFRMLFPLNALETTIINLKFEFKKMDEYYLFVNKNFPNICDELAEYITDIERNYIRENSSKETCDNRDLKIKLQEEYLNFTGLLYPTYFTLKNNFKLKKDQEFIFLEKDGISSQTENLEIHYLVEHLLTPACIVASHLTNPKCLSIKKKLESYHITVPDFKKDVGACKNYLSNNLAKHPEYDYLDYLDLLLFKMNIFIANKEYFAPRLNIKEKDINTFEFENLQEWHSAIFEKYDIIKIMYDYIWELEFKYRCFNEALNDKEAKKCKRRLKKILIDQEMTTLPENFPKVFFLKTDFQRFERSGTLPVRHFKATPLCFFKYTLGKEKSDEISYYSFEMIKFMLEFYRVNLNETKFETFERCFGYSGVYSEDKSLIIGAYLHERSYCYSSRDKKVYSV